jgi:hypothetical protein
LSLDLFGFLDNNKQNKKGLRGNKFEDKKKTKLITSKVFSMKHSSLNLFA